MQSLKVEESIIEVTNVHHRANTLIVFCVTIALLLTLTAQAIQTAQQLEFSRSYLLGYDAGRST